MIYTFYATVLGHTNSIEVDLQEERNYTQAEWDAMSEDDQLSILQEIYNDVIGNICDSGWYEGKKAD